MLLQTYILSSHIILCFIFMKNMYMFLSNYNIRTVFATTVSTVNIATGAGMGYAGAGKSYGGGSSSTPSTSTGTSSGTGAYTGSPAVLTFYSELSEIVNTINTISYFYSQGDYDSVAENFTSTTYYNLSLELAKIQKDPSIYPEFENLRQGIARALEGLNKSILIYNDYKSASLQLASVSARAAILDDMQELKKYLDSLTGSIQLFPDIEITSIAATLKPEIAVYIKLYGFPSGGVFETDKLAFALQVAESQRPV
jgi:hypothetical protein